MWKLIVPTLNYNILIRYLLVPSASATLIGMERQNIIWNTLIINIILVLLGKKLLPKGQYED